MAGPLGIFRPARTYLPDAVDGPLEVADLATVKAEPQAHFARQTAPCMRIGVFERVTSQSRM